MEYENENYNLLLKKIDEKFKKYLEKIIFLEINKNICLNEGFILKEGTLIPIKYDVFKDSIINNTDDNIELDKIVISMLFVIGCDEYFKNNTYYIEIIKNLGLKIKSFIVYNAIKYEENKMLFEALILYKAMCKIYEENIDARYNLARILKKLSSLYSDSKERDLYYNLSFYEYCRLYKDYPDYEYASYEIAFYYIENNEIEKALFYLNKAFESASDTIFKNDIIKKIEYMKDIILFNKAKSLMSENKVVEGLKIIIQLDEKYDDWSEVKYYKAYGYRRISNYVKAKTILQELLKKGEEFPEIYNELALILFEEGFLKEAISNFYSAVELSENPDYMCNLAMALYKDGQIDKARQYIKEAISRKPKDEIIINCNNYINKL